MAPADRVLELGGSETLTPRRLVEAARQSHRVRLHPDALARIEAAHRTVVRQAAGGAAIYGVSTGLGAVVDTAIAFDDAGLQRRVIRARAVGVGAEATDVEVRAVMIARLAGFACGVSGASAATVRAYAAMLAAGIHPVMPLRGSLGEADLAPLAHVALVLIGEGSARIGAQAMPGAEALRRAGLQPAALGPKDGLALVSSNAVSVALGALALDAARTALSRLTASAALAFEAQLANLSPLRADAVALRPTPGTARIAGEIRQLLEGGDLAAAAAGRRLHDPLSFRCVAPVLGALLHAIDLADAAVALALRTPDDNPAVLPGADAIVGTAGFDTTHLVLAFEMLGQAMARAASLAGARILQLMSAGTTGLPRFLAPDQDGSSGLAPLQKTVAALVADIAHRSQPMPVTILPVADGMEDYATMAVPVVRKTASIGWMLGLLAAAEMITAAQAIDLRPGHRLGLGTARHHAAIRRLVPALAEDRSLAHELQELHRALGSADL